jgi:hypothetical protein
MFSFNNFVGRQSFLFANTDVSTFLLGEMLGSKMAKVVSIMNEISDLTTNWY